MPVGSNASSTGDPAHPVSRWVNLANPRMSHVWGREEMSQTACCLHGEDDGRMRLSARLGRVNTNTIAVDYSVTVNPMVQLLIRSTNRVTCHGEGRQPQGILFVWEGEAARHRSLVITHSCDGPPVGKRLGWVGKRLQYAAHPRSLPLPNCFSLPLSPRVTLRTSQPWFSKWPRGTRPSRQSRPSRA